VDYFQQWLRHDQPNDPYWRDRVFTDTLAEVRVPVSTLGGWHDFMLPWQLRDYAQLRAAGQQPQLTIGPWGHADDASIKGWLADLLPFLGHHLRGDPAPREQPVHLYVTGAEQWRDLPDWPPAQPTSHWYLQPGRALSTTAPAPAEPDEHPYDPADPTPSVGGPADGVKVTRLDNAPLERRTDVLVYTSEPLAAALEVIGVPVVELFVSSAVPHLDVFARLCDVDPAGVSTNVSDALLRLTVDNAPVDADGVRRAQFELWPVAHRFQAGHRLRLQVSGGAFPRYPRNPGTEASLGDIAQRMVAVSRNVHHGPAHPSALALPILS
jgi:putative CocE/NonD family hydrolase